MLALLSACGNQRTEDGELGSGYPWGLQYRRPVRTVVMCQCSAVLKISICLPLLWHELKRLDLYDKGRSATLSQNYEGMPNKASTPATFCIYWKSSYAWTHLVCLLVTEGGMGQPGSEHLCLLIVDVLACQRLRSWTSRHWEVGLRLRLLGQLMHGERVCTVSRIGKRFRKLTSGKISGKRNQVQSPPWKSRCLV